MSLPTKKNMGGGSGDLKKIWGGGSGDLKKICRPQGGEKFEYRWPAAARRKIQLLRKCY